MLMAKSFPALFLLLLLPALTMAGSSTGKAQDAPRYSQLGYEAIPLGRPADEREEIEVTLTPSDQGLEYRSKTRSKEEMEEVRIQMDSEGKFIRGTRHLFKGTGEPIQEEKIWREKNQAHWQKTAGEQSRIKEYSLSLITALAVDGSLLVLLQSFPFYSGQEWNVFLIDFPTGFSITASVRQAGRERIAVPAGKFDCYRMETVVNLPILRPKIIHWLWVEKPHLMIRHEGKNGPLTPYYETSLISFRLPDYGSSPKRGGN